MHARDPVHWQRWGPKVFARARAEHKLVFVTSGYYACRWCHVMDRESFSAPAVARLLNRDFIPVAVDRELLPAVDHRLLEFVQRTRGQGGWPLNVFLTPEGYPLVGTTYLPPDQFSAFIAKLQRRWRKDPAGLKALARRAARSHPAPTAPVSAHPLEDLVSAALERADELDGGFGQQNKFPLAPQLQALLTAQARHPSAQLGGFLRLTLDRMAHRGLRDQLGGGFFRYTVDPNWQVPHFEKMLYDNAQLAMVYLRAARVLHDPAYGAVGRNTLHFMLRRMRAPDGGFVSSLSALDGKGEDGGYYLWSAAELAKVLPEPELQVARRYWQLSGPPPFDGGYLPEQSQSAAQVARELGISVALVRARVAAARRRLLTARRHRTLPRDPKVIAGWNGLALSALAEAARGKDPGGRYARAARRLAHMLARRLWDGHRLYRMAGPHGPLGQASLQDYAYVARGLWEWGLGGGNEDDRRLALALVRQAWHRFYGSGGWRRSDATLVAGGRPRAALAAGGLPAAPAVLIDVSIRIADALHLPGLDARARRALARAAPVVAADPFWYASYAPLLAGSRLRMH
ncbi:MAG: DUF255 domain-containing protein, partial [Gammaproteobacteria bacterium]